MILAIDPGTDKCGIALADDRGKIIEHRVIKRSGLAAALAKWQVDKFLIGEGAFGRALKKELGGRKEVIFVPEKNSTREARVRYWQANPPRGLWRLVPTSLRVPPVPVDDYAAIILIERYFRSLRLRPV